MTHTLHRIAAILFLIPAAGWAFNPPIDKAGPLTVRIEGPSEITKTGAPLDIRVALENAGPVAVRGRLRLGVIDHWRSDPADPVPFDVAANAAAQLDFKVTPGDPTYSAHYPIHAFAEFEQDGQRQTAHAVLILEARVPSVVRVMDPVEWRPVDVPPNGGLALWRLPTRRVVIQPFGGRPQVMPVGWSGSEEGTRASVHFGERVQRGRPQDVKLDPRRYGGYIHPDFLMQRGPSQETVGIHPPWFEGKAGAAFVEYPVRLPDGLPIRLFFANAIRDHDAAHNEPPSDGVTFRVRVLDFDAPPAAAGEVIFEKHTDAKIWQPADVDLSRWAGKTVRLQLESHPGPKNDTTCDQSFWAEPTLIAGTPPKLDSPPPAWDAVGAVSLGTFKRGDTPGEVRFWLGKRGFLDAAIGIQFAGKQLFFRGLSIRVLNDTLSDWLSLSTLLEVKKESVKRGLRLRHCFKGRTGTFDLLAEMWTEPSGALRVKVWLENAPPPRPWVVAYLEDVSAGPWDRQALQIYLGDGSVIRKPDAFRVGFEGHALSTSFVGFDFDNGLSLVQAVDVPPSHVQVDPQARLYSLHVPHAQTMTFIPSLNVWDAVKIWRDVNGLKPAGGVAKLAGRFVFDLWGGDYAPSADALQRAARYGLTDAVVVWHNWQRWGYDYRLPDIYPPNPHHGTLEDFRRLVQVCKNNGVLFAPHDNYIDFYPDAEGYSYEHMAFYHEGQPVRAWLNEGRKAQSYRFRADRFRPFLERNLKLIYDNLAPTAFFIDVWSSICPYDYWTHDGQFVDRVFTRNAWGQAFAWIRDLLGDNAPQISESGHDQLIGWLDGAQTNHMRADISGIRFEDAERTPWYDAAHHDRFILHGAGYESRYVSGLDRRLHGIYSDDYITTEVLTGHPAMVPGPFGREIVRKYWLLHDLMRALALRRIDGVQYADANLHRQHVQWSDGAKVWVNRGAEDWTVADHILPQYGFYASVPTPDGPVEAAIERRDGTVVDWSRGPSGFYVNARPPAIGPPSRQIVSVESLKFVGDRTGELVLAWQARRQRRTQLTVFVHFVDEKGAILFQADHDLPTDAVPSKGVVRTSARFQVPAQFKPGDQFELRVGLYRPGEDRVPLPGNDDGERRIRLGTLRLDGQEKTLTGMTWSPLKPSADPLLARQNKDEKPVLIGPVATDGACRISLHAKQVQITPLPEGTRFTIRLRWNDLPWKLPRPKHVIALSEDGKALTTTPAQWQADDLLLTCDPETFALRLSETPVKEPAQ